MPRRIRTGAAALVVVFSLALPACGWRELEAQLTEPVPQALPEPQIEWKRSVAVGSPSAGRLVRAVRLPAEGEHFFTWDPVKRRSPNRVWRRWGTDVMVRLVLRIAREYGEAHPYAPRVAVGDLSRPRGGDFGPQFGFIGHVSHQNGLDVDIYYPRADRRERAPRNASEIDRRLSQDLVDRFVEAGAVKVFVGPGTRLTGPPGVVMPLVHHDNHLHARIAPRR
jgi:murein endopeptidase